MNMPKENISGIQILSLITAFIQGSILWISFTTNLTKHDTWLAVLSGLIISIPFTLCYAALIKKFASQNFVQILETILGPYLGKAVVLLYICYFWLLLVFNIEGFGEFESLLMPETPFIVPVILFTAVCAYAAFTGIEVLARLGFFFMFVGFFIIFSTFFLLLKDMQATNFLPFFEVPIKDFIHGMHIIITIPLLEIVVFLIIMPCLNNKKNTIQYTLTGLLLGGLSFLVVSVRNTAILGNIEPYFTSPSFQVSRFINIGDILTRMEVLTVIGYITDLFLKCGILYYCVVLSLSQLLRLRTYTPLIIPIGCISVTLSMIVFDSIAAHLLDAQNFSPVYASLFSLVLPPLLLLITKIRGLTNEKDSPED